MRPGQEDAQRLYEQLRAANEAALGDRPARIDPALLESSLQEFLDTLTAEERAQPWVREAASWDVTDVNDLDDRYGEVLTRMQDDIEAALRTDNEGLDLERRRPLVRFLRTGQLNAVSMRAPGSGAYLVLLEDQMADFAHRLAEAVVMAIPHRGVGPDGMVDWEFSLPAVVERVDGAPETVARFARSVVQYAVAGRFDAAADEPVPREHRDFALRLVESLECFVVAHEYAHVLAGHLDGTPTRSGVLPVPGIETLGYSWMQELDADALGWLLSSNAGRVRNRGPAESFLGVGLFFDVLDVMDRAVSLLDTGDEHAYQLGTHPPSSARGQHLREFLRNVPALRPDVVGVVDVQGEVIRLLWDRTRPLLQDLHDRGVRSSRVWQNVATAGTSRLAVTVDDRFRRTWSVADAEPAPAEVGPHEVELPAGALRNADLRATDMSRARLRGQDLHGMDLSASAFHEADLRGANLRGAVLTDTELFGADLTGADLTRASLARASLFRADLTGADLTGADLTEVSLNTAVLVRATLVRARLTGAELGRADLRGADLTGADLTGADLTGADVSGADLTGVRGLHGATRTSVTSSRSTTWPAGGKPARRAWW